jgi:hypothetical protein
MLRTLIMSLSVSSLLIFTSGCTPCSYYTAPPPSPRAGSQYPHWVYYNEIPPNGARMRDVDRAFRAGRLNLEDYREAKRALQGE